ncbi:L-alanine dehydrogenase [Methanocella conradii HZ254]|uniref:Alanine dehydrogenase n=1 Tax=Methanocella conradii (strain DSM 24694 / JCM 17849 / CGMCC 1.5162 / HZ254) TaxID=1041930 RepID=H8I6G1_METCZ|nr:alanine dehydrogenase [Methanocella conradii]AFD01159.1 L-alanine dehydrogenase [Methanocella conradii HZ254]MDI6897002.1 alanine dehydrogenase [Methanocella conradii]
MVRLINDAEARRLLPMRDAIGAVERAFAEYAEGRTRMPGKIYLDIEGYGDFRAMPAYVPSVNKAGVKWVNVHPDNPSKGLPTVMATLLLNDPMTGKLICIINAGGLTDLRTGAAGGVAAKYLARKDSSVIGVIGSGHQAWTQMLAYREVFGSRVKLVKVYSRHMEHADAFAGRVRAELGYDARAYKTAEEVADADIVATVTPARRPVLIADWVKPGTHINAIGADAPGKQELESALTIKARVFVDSIEQASHSGEINVPWRQGLINEKKLAGTIGEVIIGRVPGRTSDDEITIFDSTGLGIQDVAVGHVVYEKALKENVGIEFSL